MSDLTLPPLAATVLFVVACWCGHRYRYVWKAEGATWQLWAYGLISGAAFLTLGFIPIA